MRHPRKTFIAIAISLTFLLTQLLGQQPIQGPPQTVIRINVNLVQVDAVVTDSNGKPVTDLKREDFELFQDGKPQTITAFDFIDIREAPRRGTPPRRLAPRAGVPAPLLSNAPLRPEQIRRTTTKAISVVISIVPVTAMP